MPSPRSPRSAKPPAEIPAAAKFDVQAFRIRCASAMKDPIVASIVAKVEIHDRNTPHESPCRICDGVVPQLVEMQADMERAEARGMWVAANPEAHAKEQAALAAEREAMKAAEKAK